MTDEEREQIRLGLEIAARRRAEIAYNNPVPVRPVPVQLPQHEDNNAGSSPTVEAAGVPDFPSQIKIWSLVVIHGANENHGGAVRVWFFARALDRFGSGWVKKADLWEFLRSLGVIERTRRRWLRDALRLGLLIERKGVYTLAGLGRGAFLLGCEHIGRPALVGAADLVRPGWRDYVWSAFLTTTRERPVSQSCKRMITGVSERSQRYHQARTAGTARRNYVKTNLPGDHLHGVREFGRRSAFVSRRLVAGRRRPRLIDPGGRIMFRLPDARHVPLFVALLGKKGRSKKAQKTLHNLSFSGRVKGSVYRLFHVTPGAAERAIRHMTSSDIPPWELPAELFERVRGGRRADIWMPVPVGVQL